LRRFEAETTKVTDAVAPFGIEAVAADRVAESTGTGPINLAGARGAIFTGLRLPQLPRTPLPRRPSGKAPMYSMYVAFGVLQGLDAYTTLTAVERGARESNPVVGGLTGNPPALIAAKAASTVVTIYAMEKIRKRNPLAVAIAMAAIDSAYLTIVAHNTAVLRR
jgi:hypothetical protein